VGLFLLKLSKTTPHQPPPNNLQMVRTQPVYSAKRCPPRWLFVLSKNNHLEYVITIQMARFRLFDAPQEGEGV